MRRPTEASMRAVQFSPPADLHPATTELIRRFAAALAAKLKRAEDKYGYRDGWRQSDWKEECQRHLLEHVGKGDPLDVAAYCAFMWFHGWPTGGTRLIAAAPELLAHTEQQATMIDGLIERLSEAGLLDDMDRTQFNGWSQEHRILMDKACDESAPSTHGEQDRDSNG